MMPSNLLKKHLNNDPYKPNFVFSSDIPAQIHQIVKTRYLPHHDNEHSIIFLGSDIEFNINTALNSLLLRNSNIKPSDLLKENLISIAKYNSCLHTSDFISRIMKPPNVVDNFGIDNQILCSEEVFIVNITLKLLDFAFDKELQDVTVDFLKDENLGLLILCDDNLLNEIISYIRACVLFSIHSNELATPILQAQVPPKEDMIYNSFIEINDSTLNNSENEEVYDKSGTGESLGSITTTNCLDLLTQESLNNKTLSLVNGDISSGQVSIDSSIDYLAKTSSNDELSKQKSPDFLLDIENLRHNEEDDIQDEIKDEEPPTTVQDDMSFLRPLRLNSRREQLNEDTAKTEEVTEAPRVLDLDPNTSSSSFHLDDLVEVECENENEFESPKTSDNPDYSSPDNILQPPVQLKPTVLTSRTNKEQEEEDDGIITISRQLSFVSPRKMKSVSRMSSTSSIFMLNTDEGLEYAFKSNDVPSYIKRDKKFKFIRVGKVQKYVHLFEEKMEEPVPPAPPGRLANSRRPSRVGSRLNSRSGSPFRTA